MNKTIAAIGLAAAAGSANAVLVIETMPGALTGTENILFNDTGLISQGPLVQGLTSETLLVVDYFDAGEDLLAGKARVQAVDGGLTQFSVEMNDPGLGFAAYQFNLDAMGTGDVTINVYQHGALSLTETFSVDKQGPNWFRIYGTEKEAFSTVEVTSTVELGAVRNNRANAVPNPVPEPSAFAALGVGLIGLLWARRKS